MYFALKKRNSTEEKNSTEERRENPKDIRDFFTEDEWTYYVEMDYQVNEGLQSTLKKRDGKITMVLESNMYKPALVSDSMKKMGVDVTELDIKNAESDSSAGESPDSDKIAVTQSVAELHLAE